MHVAAVASRRTTSLVDAGSFPWQLAAFGQERLETSAPDPPDERRARQRLEWWTELVAFRGPEEDLDGKLRPLGMTAGQLAALLGEREDDLSHRLRAAPEWLRWFARAWEAAGSPEPDLALPSDLGLLECARPLLREAQRRLRDGLGELPDLLCGAGSLPLQEVGMAVGPAMVLELNVARLEGRLRGATPQDRLAWFLDGLRNGDVALEIWREYPVLARYVVEVLDGWVRSRLRFAERLSKDFDRLQGTLWHGCDPGPLRTVEFGAGDSHGGESVTLLRFAHAGVVYKPRPLAVDVAFGRLVEAFNADGPRHLLGLPGVVDRASYGWTELVEGRPCATEGEARTYYWRLGALLALLHALNATDLHSENLIAAGCHPMLVDLEAMFQPDMPALMGGADGQSDDPAAELLGASVMSTALLPVTVMVDDCEGGQPFGVDLSGMAGDGGQRSFLPVAVLEDQDGDTMRFVPRHVTMPTTQNRPRSPDGSPVKIGAFRNDLVEGFRSGYEWLQRRRPELLGEPGLIAAFARVPVRMVARPTHLYGQVLCESLHPDFLRDGLDRERCLARLCEGWAEAPGREEMIAAEITALAHGDIPVFRIRPGSRDVWLEDGTVVAGVLGSPPLWQVRDRIGGLGAEDLERQVSIIEGCLAAFGFGEGEQPGGASSTPLPGEPVSRDRLLDAALDIGRRLAELAVHRGRMVGWLSLTAAGERHWQLASARLDVYGGLPGIGLFLSYLADQTGDPSMRALAQQVAEQTVLQAHTYRRSFEALAAGAPGSESEARRMAIEGSGVGVFGPLLGPVYCLAHAGRLHRDGGLVTAARELLVPFVRAGIEADESFDLVSGSAGCILALLALHEVAPDSDALELAGRAAERLLATAVPAAPAGAGCGWRVSGLGDRPLAGLAHGSSGITLALARLHATRPEACLLPAIAGGLRHEAGLFDRRARNWPDLRSPGSRFMTAWCYGAAGIGLTRLELLGHDFLAERRPALEADVRHAVATTAAAGLLADPVTGIGNHSICHGDLGNLELLHAASATARWGMDPERVGRVLAALVQRGIEQGWACGTPSPAETPGLMIGLAGIGYNLLRFADPAAVPSVLLAEPPRPAAGLL
jgi:type 2 lantibiotic biosynthesis protein LanM